MVELLQASVQKVIGVGQAVPAALVGQTGEPASRASVPASGASQPLQASWPLGSQKQTSAVPGLQPTELLQVWVPVQG
jgi:hypothetical protein